MSVAVDNTRAVPVTIYLERGAFDSRLGTIAAHTKGTLTLPRSITASETIRIVVHPAGGIDLSTPDLTMKRGETLEVYVPLGNEGFLPPPPEEVIPNPGPGTTTLTVENESDRKVTVYIERGDFDTRIGMVDAHGKATFSLPPEVVRDDRSLEIFVHPDLGQDLASQTLEVHRGAHLLVKVPR
jgi:hypothetical protein